MSDTINKDLTDLHAGLPDEELRKYLAKAFMQYGKSCNYVQNMEYLRKQINYYYGLIISLEAFIRVSEQAKEHGWLILKSPDNTPFVGTTDEFEKMCLEKRD